MLTPLPKGKFISSYEDCLIAPQEETNKLSVFCQTWYSGIGYDMVDTPYEGKENKYDAYAFARKIIWKRYLYNRLRVAKSKARNLFSVL